MNHIRRVLTALAAAAVAVLLDRAWAARKVHST